MRGDRDHVIGIAGVAQSEHEAEQHRGQHRPVSRSRASTRATSAGHVHRDAAASSPPCRSGSDSRARARAAARGPRRSSSGRALELHEIEQEGAGGRRRGRRAASSGAPPSRRAAPGCGCARSRARGRCGRAPPSRGSGRRDPPARPGARPSTSGRRDPPPAPATAASITQPSISGSSPWMFTTTAASSESGDLGEPVGAGLVVGARHRHLGSEAATGVGDARVLGGDDDPLQALRAARAFPDASHHRNAGDRRERLAGEARGLPPRRDHADRRHGRDPTGWIEFPPWFPRPPTRPPGRPSSRFPRTRAGSARPPSRPTWRSSCARCARICRCCWSASTISRSLDRMFALRALLPGRRQPQARLGRAQPGPRDPARAVRRPLRAVAAGSRAAQGPRRGSAHAGAGSWPRPSGPGS